MIISLNSSNILKYNANNVTPLSTESVNTYSPFWVILTSSVFFGLFIVLLIILISHISHNHKINKTFTNTKNSLWTTNFINTNTVNGSSMKFGQISYNKFNKFLLIAVLLCFLISAALITLGITLLSTKTYIDTAEQNAITAAINNQNYTPPARTISDFNSLPILNIDNQQLASQSAVAISSTPAAQQSSSNNTTTLKRTNTKSNLSTFATNNNINYQQFITWLKLSNMNKMTKIIDTISNNNTIILLIKSAINVNIDPIFFIDLLQNSIDHSNYTLLTKLLNNYPNLTVTMKSALKSLFYQNAQQLISILSLNIFDASFIGSIGNPAELLEILLSITTNDQITIINQLSNTILLFITSNQGLLKKMLSNNINLTQLDSWANSQSINNVSLAYMYNNYKSELLYLLSSTKLNDIISGISASQLSSWLANNYQDPNLTSSMISGSLIAALISQSMNLSKIANYSTTFFAMINSGQLNAASFVALVQKNLNPQTSNNNEKYVVGLLNAGISLDLIVQIINNSKLNPQVITIIVQKLQLTSAQLSSMLSSGIVLDILLNIINNVSVNLSQLQNIIKDNTHLTNLCNAILNNPNNIISIISQINSGSI